MVALSRYGTVANWAYANNRQRWQRPRTDQLLIILTVPTLDPVPNMLIHCSRVIYAVNARISVLYFLYQESKKE